MGDVWGSGAARLVVNSSNDSKFRFCLFYYCDKTYRDCLAILPGAKRTFRHSQLMFAFGGKRTRIRQLAH